MEFITINGELITELASKQDWVNRVPRCLKRKTQADQFLFVDVNNNCLTIGEDFRVAEETASYPVRIYRLQRVAEAAAKEVANG